MAIAGEIPVHHGIRIVISQNAYQVCRNMRGTCLLTTGILHRKTTQMNDPVHPARSRADLLLFAAAVAGLAIALFDFFWWRNGIHGTAGALLVVISSALLTGAAASLIFATMSRRLVVTLTVLIALGIAGTALAAYMLEANILLAVTGLMLIGWIMQRISPAAPGGNRQPVVSQ